VFATTGFAIDQSHTVFVENIGVDSTGTLISATHVRADSSQPMSAFNATDSVRLRPFPAVDLDITGIADSEEVDPGGWIRERRRSADNEDEFERVDTETVFETDQPHTLYAQLLAQTDEEASEQNSEGGFEEFKITASFTPSDSSEGIESEDKVKLTSLPKVDLDIVRDSSDREIPDSKELDPGGGIEFVDNVTDDNGDLTSTENLVELKINQFDPDGRVEEEFGSGNIVVSFDSSIVRIWGVQSASGLMTELDPDFPTL